MNRSRNERLTKARKTAGYTQTTFSAKVGIPFRTYQSYEQGRRIPREPHMRKIMQELNLKSTDVFFHKSDDENMG